MSTKSPGRSPRTPASRTSIMTIASRVVHTLAELVRMAEANTGQVLFVTCLWTWGFVSCTRPADSRARRSARALPELVTERCLTVVSSVCTLEPHGHAETRR
jgi:hypothetical protein